MTQDAQYHSCALLLLKHTSLGSAALADFIAKSDKHWKVELFRYSQYLQVVERLDRFAQENCGKRVFDLAIRGALDKAGEM